MVNLHDAQNGPEEAQNGLEQALGFARALWAELDPDRHGRGRTVAWANRFLEAHPVTNARGDVIRVVRQPARGPHYEVAILFHGALAFRESSCHDWFNLLSWPAWPRAKAALNLRHALHYLVQLRGRYGAGWQEHLGARLPRDAWMQSIANLDEAGCVASRALIDGFTSLDAIGIYHWRRPPPPPALEAGLRWFGHAILEHFTLETPHPPPRMWITVLEELEDEPLARRILTFDPGLEADIGGALELVDGIDAWFRSALCFAEGDPFRKPGRSIPAPWPVAVPEGVVCPPHEGDDSTARG